MASAAEGSRGDGRPFDKLRASSRLSLPVTLPFAGSCSLSSLNLHCDINKRQRSPAESLVFAEHQGQVSANVGIGELNRNQNVSLHVLLHIRSRNESNANIGGHETLEQFARIQFHGVTRF